VNAEEVIEMLGQVKDDSPNANLIKHVKKMIDMSKCLNEDVQEAGELFRFTTYEFAARTCIRTLFSELEAKMFLFHELILHMHSLSIITLSPEEIMLLKEKACSVSASGKITTSQKFIPFKENLLFTLDLCSRFLNKNVFRDTNDKRWQDVLPLCQDSCRLGGGRLGPVFWPDEAVSAASSPV